MNGAAHHSPLLFGKTWPSSKWLFSSDFQTLWIMQCFRTPKSDCLAIVNHDLWFLRLIWFPKFKGLEQSLIWCQWWIQSQLSGLVIKLIDMAKSQAPLRSTQGNFPSCFAKVRWDGKVIATPIRLLKLLKRIMDLAAEKNLKYSYSWVFCLLFVEKGKAFGAF